MSDMVSAFPRVIGPRPETAPPDPTVYGGNLNDPALAVPLAPGQDASHEQVIIGNPPALSDRDIERLLTIQFREAKIYDDRLQIARAQTFRLYNGEPMGDEEPGRSQIVLTEVKDTINAMMPTMMRTFAGADLPVEFFPRADGDDEEARQAQDYVNHVVFVENDGWRALHDSILDALQLKAGWLKWWWDYTVDVKTEHYFGLLAPQCATLLNEPGVTALRVVRRPATPAERAGILASPDAVRTVMITPGTALLVYDAQITRRAPRNRPRLMAVPSEQVLIDTDASGPQDPCLRFIGHWRIVTVSDLVALGFPKELIETRITQLQQQTNRVSRRRDRLAAIVPRQQTGDPAMRRVRYLDCWMRFDYDGDGIAELHHLHAIGDYGFLLIGHEPAAHVPLARVCPYPVSHRAIGESVADRIGDIQRAMTRVFRNILDSMAESIHPRTVIEQGMVETDDVLNTEMGAVIREKKAGAVRELTKPFIGPAALPLMEALSAAKESRTGITRSSQGLTADALQSTTAIAVSAQVAASADRLELVVRAIAEGVRDLYEGVLRLMCEHQDRARGVLLRGVWTEVDPRAWRAGFNIGIRVGIGHGSVVERLSTLNVVLQQQKEAVTTMGPNNPLCTLGMIRNTLADMLRAAGIANAARYFNPLPTSYQYQPPPPPPDPNMVLAQAEMQKNQADAQADRDKQQTDRLIALLEDDRARDEASVKAVLEAADIAGKYGMTVDLPAITGLLRRGPASIGTLIASQSRSAVPLAPAPQAGGIGGGGAGEVPLPGASAQIGAGPAPRGPGATGSATSQQSTIQPGLAQRLFLPPQLITALSTANRPAPPMLGPLPMSRPASPAPAPSGFGA